MKLSISLAFFLGLIINLHGQIFDPVSWNYQWKNIAKNEYELQFIAQIDEGWNIYSQYLEWVYRFSYSKFQTSSLTPGLIASRIYHALTSVGLGGFKLEQDGSKPNPREC